MSVLIIEEKPPHFTDVEFEYKGIEFKAQICLLDTGKVMISFRVPKNELEQNLCKGLLNSRGTKLDIHFCHLWFQILYHEQKSNFLLTEKY